MSDGCICQDCENNYTVDLMVPAELWEKIKPQGKPKGAGLLCGSCIMRKVEEITGFAAFEIKNL